MRIERLMVSHEKKLLHGFMSRQLVLPLTRSPTLLLASSHNQGSAMEIPVHSNSSNSLSASSCAQMAQLLEQQSHSSMVNTKPVVGHVSNCCRSQRSPGSPELPFFLAYCAKEDATADRVPPPSRALKIRVDQILLHAHPL